MPYPVSVYLVRSDSCEIPLLQVLAAAIHIWGESDAADVRNSIRREKEKRKQGLPRIYAVARASA